LYDLTLDNRRAQAFVLLAIITGLALTLRLTAAQESLYGDELFTYYDATAAALPDVLDRMSDWENSPPAYFVLAWLGAQLGDPTTWIRLPAVMAGAASVPALYFLAEAIGGRRSAIIAASLYAVLPFAVFYGSEARGYAFLLLLFPLSTLALLRALEAKEGLRWWVLYGAASALLLYSHYTAGIGIAAQAGWALLSQPRHRRVVLAANAAVALAFLPWLPMVNTNTKDLPVLEALHPLTIGNVLTDSLRVAFGHPFAAAAQVPGVLAIFAACAGCGLIATGMLRPALRRSVSDAGSWPIGGSLGVPWVGWLLGSMTAGVLALTLAFSVVDTSIYTPRNVITALPYLCVLAGIAAAALRDRLALIAAGALVLAALLGSVRMLADYPRPDLRAAADAIADRASPGTPVIEPRALGHTNRPQENPLEQDLAIYLDDEFPLSHQLAPANWPRGREVDTVVHGPFLSRRLDAIALQVGAKPLETLSFDGFADVTVNRFSPIGGTAGSGRVPLRLDPERLHAYLQQHPKARERFRRALQGD
jgi:mannosyltransferase